MNASDVDMGMDTKGRTVSFEANNVLNLVNFNIKIYGCMPFPMYNLRMQYQIKQIMLLMANLG